MNLGDLLRKYAGVSCSTPPDGGAEGVCAGNRSPDLPADIGQWPEEWRSRLQRDAETLEGAVGMNKSEARASAEPAVRYEYGKTLGKNRQADTE